MPEVAFTDLDGDMLHVSPTKTYPYTDLSAKYEGTYSLEIEMLAPGTLPVLYFTPDQLRALASILALAAEQLEKKRSARS